MILEDDSRPCLCNDERVNTECTFTVCGFQPGWYSADNIDNVVDSIINEISLWKDYQIVNIEYHGLSDKIVWQQFPFLWNKPKIVIQGILIS